jgi:hypothetical protein
MFPVGKECSSLNRSASASSKPARCYLPSGSLDEPHRPGLVPESASEPVAGLPTKPARPDLSRTSPEEVIARRRVVFLVGAPRSGTTWLQLLLSRSPHIATANETHLFTGYTRSLFTAWAHHQCNVRAAGLHNLMSEEAYFDLIRNFTCKVMLRILERSRRQISYLRKFPIAFYIGAIS